MKAVVTGGAGFVGSNLTERWLSKGYHVTVFDNLSHPGGGAERNLEYIRNKYASNPNLEFIQGDVVKSGTHKQLIEREGKYSELYREG